MAVAFVAQKKQETLEDRAAGSGEASSLVSSLLEDCGKADTGVADRQDVCRGHHGGFLRGEKN